MKLQNKILLTLLIAGLLALNFACPKKKGTTVVKKDLWGQTFEITNKGRTPSGAHIWQQNGTTITPEDMAAIDDGLTRLFAKAKCHISEHHGKPLSDADRGMTHQQYIVAVLKSTDVSADGIPAIRIPPGQYAGTEYDKGGYILIAGQMLALGEPYGNVIAIPDYQANFKGMSDIVEYEGEHVVAGHHLPTLYHANETHGQGKGHPFIGNCPGAIKPTIEVVKPSSYAVGVYETPYGKSLIFLTK